MIFVVHECFISLPSNFRGIVGVFALGANLGVVHACAMEEVGVGGAGLQGSNLDLRVFQLVAQRSGERKNEAFEAPYTASRGAGMPPAIEDVNSSAPSPR